MNTKSQKFGLVVSMVLIFILFQSLMAVDLVKLISVDQAGNSVALTSKGSANGDNIIKVAYSGSTFHKWTITPYGDGYSKVVNVGSSKAMECWAPAGEQTNRDNVGQSSVNNFDWQKWLFEDMGGGLNKTTGKYNPRVLDADTGSDNFHVYEFYDASQRKWTIESMEALPTPTPVVGSWTKVDDRNNGIVYIGPWGNDDGARYSEEAYSETLKWTGTSSSTAGYTFIGTGIWIGVKKAKNGRDFKIYINDELKAIVSAYNASAQYQLNIYENTDPWSVSHTVMDEKINSGYSQLDYFEYYSGKTTPTPSYADALGQIEEEDYNSMSDIGIYSNDGGEKTGLIEDGPWTHYLVDFGSDATSFDVDLASDTSGGTLELRLGSATSTLIGNTTVGDTGCWSTFESKNCSITSISGDQTLYLVADGGIGFLFDVDFFQCSTGSSTATPTIPVIEDIPGLPDRNSIVQAWQLDFNSYDDGVLNYFCTEGSINTVINIGYGTVWHDMRIKADLVSENYYVAIEDYAENDLINSDGIETEVSFRVDGVIGTYSRIGVSDATSEEKGSLTHDYMYVDQSGTEERFERVQDPVSIHIENLDYGTYQILFITADWEYDRRWNTEGEGFDLDVPHAPFSDSITQNSIRSPEFTVTDGSIDMVWSAMPDNSHDASIAGIVIIQKK